MSFDADRLFALLPAFERVRDAAVARQSRTPAEQEAVELLRARLALAVRDDPDGADAQRLGRRLRRAEAGPLRALVEVLAEQAMALEDDLAQLYDDCFIETCAEWAVPYIGELVGTRGMAALADSDLSRRAQVANTIAYRRRKGTAAVIEQLARDVTNWDASVVEYFDRLISNQYLNHLRPHSRATVSMRGFDDEEQVDGPFSRTAHTVDVRHVARGRYNIPNIGIFLWRVRSLSATRSPALRIDARRYLVHPLGLETQLYNRPVSEDQISHLATAANVPHALGRRALARRFGQHYGADRALALEVDGVSVPCGAFPAIGVCDLRDVPDGQGGVSWAHAPSNKIGIDPVLGRIVFPQDLPPECDVWTTYHYGFGGALGGGEYARARTADAVPVTMLSTAPAGATGTLQDALDCLGGRGRVVIRDSGRFAASGVGGATIAAGDEAAIAVRATARSRPTVALGGDLIVHGGEGAEVTLDGLLIGGGTVRVPAMGAGGRPNGLRKLRIVHCTLLPTTVASPTLSPASPPASSLTVSAGVELIVESSAVTVEIERSIVGAVRAVDGAEVTIRDSVVDAGDATAVAYATLDGVAAGASLDVAESTLVGKVHAAVLDASNTLFQARLGAGDPWPAPVLAERLQQGCVRFSFVPLDARVARRHRCRPHDLADAVRVTPTFRSLRYGDAGYALLSARTPAAITTGADDQGEMGAFHHLKRPQREAALWAQLHEYLRFGYEAGVFYAGEQEGE